MGRACERRLCLFWLLAEYILKHLALLHLSLFWQAQRRGNLGSREPGINLKALLFCVPFHLPQKQHLCLHSINSHSAPRSLGLPWPGSPARQDLAYFGRICCNGKQKALTLAAWPPGERSLCMVCNGKP
jgi:hypothetical protein